MECTTTTPSPCPASSVWNESCPAHEKPHCRPTLRSTQAMLKRHVKKSARKRRALAQTQSRARLRPRQNEPSNLQRIRGDRPYTKLETHPATRLPRKHAIPPKLPASSTGFSPVSDHEIEMPKVELVRVNDCGARGPHGTCLGQTSDPLLG